MVIWIAAAPAWAGGRAIYAFTDAQGVTHFTNRPHSDKRFKPVRLRDPRVGAQDTARRAAAPTIR